LNVNDSELLETLRQLLWAVELKHALRKIIVSLILIFRDPLSYARQYGTEIKPVTRPQNRERRYRKIQYGNPPAWLAHANHFGKSSLRIANVSQSKSNGNDGESALFKGQLQRIANGKMERRAVFALLLSDFNHFGGEVDAMIRPFDSTLFLLLHESEGKIACTAANVQNFCVSGVGFDSLPVNELPGGTSSPRMMNTQRKNMIDPLVSRRNCPKHLANTFR
jgi:hypothetical protein